MFQRKMFTLFTLAAMAMSSLSLSAQIIINRSESPKTTEDSPKKKEKTENDRLAEALLQRAYGLSKQVTEADRGYLLARLAEVSAKKQPDKSLAWASEVFALSANLPLTNRRSQNELTAMMAVAENDADKAFQYLSKMEVPQPRDGQGGPDMRNGAATMLFQKQWQKHGMEGLELLESTARQMGDSGQYPYMAMGLVIRQVRAKDPDRAQTMLNDALKYYSQRSGKGGSNDQFAMFLRNNRDNIPKPLLKDMLEKLVAEALATKDDGSNVQMVMSTDKGVSASMTGAANLILGQLIPMIRDVDPEWAKKLEAEHEELRAMAEAAQSNEQRMMVVQGPRGGQGGQGGQPPRNMMEEMKSMQVDELSSRDPQRAAQMQSEISDPVLRASSGARLASALMKSDPERANELLKNAKSALSEAKEPQDKLRILIGLAQAQAAMDDKTAFAETLATGYAMGEDLFRQSFDKSPDLPIFARPGFNAMSQLTASAVKLDYNATMTKLDGIHSPVLQALLLVSAAEGLDPDARPRGQGVRIVIGG